jgi:hypothetical protein
MAKVVLSRALLTAGAARTLDRFQVEQTDKRKPWVRTRLSANVRSDNIDAPDAPRLAAPFAPSLASPTLARALSVGFVVVAALFLTRYTQ